LIDKCLWWMNEFESLIYFNLSLFINSLIHLCDWLIRLIDVTLIHWLICLLLWDWLIREISNC
jgi:hypothetical protein